jgi:hypothetical protein
MGQPIASYGYLKSLVSIAESNSVVDYQSMRTAEDILYMIFLRSSISPSLCLRLCLLLC